VFQFSLCAVLFLLTIPIPLSSQDLAAFEPQSIYLPLIVDGRAVGEIETIPMEELDTEIHARQLYELLQGRVAEDKLQDLAAYPEEWITIEQLQQFPFEASFNMFDLTIEVTVPPESSVSREISLASTGDPIEYTQIEPAEFSFYTNIYSSFTFGNYDDYIDDEVTFTPTAQINLNPTFNLDGWVLQTRFTISTTAANPLSVGSMQITKDWPEKPMRVMIGDLTYKTATNQSSPSYFGAVLSQDRSKSFEKQTPGDFSYTFLVPEDNLLVRVLMNGRSIKRERLNANLYTLTDFYFSSGLNQFEIEMEKEDQVLSSEQFIFAYDSRLTPIGQEQFTAGFGFKNSDLQQLPELFGMHQFGLSDHSSGEYFLQAGSNQQNLGVSLIYATKLGNFKISGAGTSVGFTSFGYYGSLGYSYLRPGSNANRTFSLTAGYESSSYKSFSNSTVPGDSQTSVRLSGGYSQTLFSSLGFSSNANVMIDRAFQVDNILFNINLSTRITPTISMSARFRGEWDEDSFSPQLTVSANINPKNSNLSTALRQDVINGENSFSMRYSPENIARSASFSMSGSGISTEDPLPTNLSFGGSFNHRDYTFSAEQRITRSTTVSYITALNFNTAISYADGLFGISRPISDSFILIAPKQNLEGYVMGINPTGSDFVARTDEFGAGVIYNLSSFTSHNVVLEPIELPDGFEIGADRYTFSPTPQQGAALRLGIESNVTVIGVMEFSDGTPVALYPGEYVHTEQEGEQVGYFFTNTDGTYEIYGLRSGDYQVTLFLGDGLNFTLTIPEGKTGILNAKKIILPVSYKVF
jgi:outer membrane usher protein